MKVHTKITVKEIPRHKTRAEISTGRFPTATRVKPSHTSDLNHTGKKAPDSVGKTQSSYSWRKFGQN